VSTPGSSKCAALGLLVLLAGGCGRTPARATAAAEQPLDEPGRVALAAAVRAQQQGMHEQVGPLLARLLALDPPPADAQFVAGSAAYDLGLYGEAAQRLDDAVRRKPEFLGAATALGFARRRLGDYASAADTFRQVVAERPEAYKAHYGLGLLALDGGRVPEARAHLEHALALRPDYLKARFALARVLIEEQRLDEARQALEALLVQWPSHEQALYHLAQVLSALGQHDAAAAVLARREETYRRGEEVGGLLARRRAGDKDPRLSARLTELYLALGELDDASRELQLGLHAAPQDPELQALVAQVQLARQQHVPERGGTDDD
jgi:tetratricopeptide (TPR) repeat protein